MDYNEFLNNIYSQFKNNNHYISNHYIKFFKENNTNIVNFEVNDMNLGIIRGTIVEQANSVLIYFCIKNEMNDCIVLSKANISMKNMATITNVLVNKGNYKMMEKIRRKFNRREELYKSSSYDEFMEDSTLDSEFTDLISNIIDKYNQKSIQKRHKI